MNRNLSRSLCWQFKIRFHSNAKWRRKVFRHHYDVQHSNVCFQQDFCTIVRIQNHYDQSIENEFASEVLNFP